MVNDSELLLRYVAGSEAAFTELVERHVNLVYAAALRRVAGDPQTAEEVTLSVFTQCARKAASLRDHPALSGWLHCSTRYAAIDAMRARRRREQAEKAFQMDPELINPPSQDSPWSEIRPLIDAVLDRLSEQDRNAMVLRFFEGRSFAQIGSALRLSEDAARMRVDRALDRLHAALARRGVKSTAAVLGAALAHHGVLAAPAGLAAVVSASALAVGSGGALSMISLFLMNKLQAGALAAIIAMGLSAVVIESHATRATEQEIGATRDQLRELRSAAPMRAMAAPNDSSAELARLEARISQLKKRPEGVVDSDIVPRSDWKNAGHATPEAALETFCWAAFDRHYDELASSFVFGEVIKKQADDFFASLPAAVQAKYQTPERLYAQYIFEVPPGHQAELKGINGIEPIELVPTEHPDEVVMRYWIQSSDGSGHLSMLPFRRVGDQWLMGSRKWGIKLPTSVEFARKVSEPAAQPVPMANP